MESKTILNTSEVTVQSRNTPESGDIPGYALSLKTGVNLQYEINTDVEQHFAVLL